MSPGTSVVRVILLLFLLVDLWRRKPKISTLQAPSRIDWAGAMRNLHAYHLLRIKAKRSTPCFEPLGCLHTPHVDFALLGPLCPSCGHRAAQRRVAAGSSTWLQPGCNLLALQDKQRDGRSPGRRRLKSADMLKLRPKSAENHDEGLVRKNWTSEQ